MADLEFGRISPPNLYSLNVLSKTKQQFKYSILGVTEKCPIKSLMEFKYNSKHSGSIHNLGLDPFFVYYWSNHQLIIYKDVCKTYCRLSIDATGGLIKKLKKSSLNIISNNIFLYEAVISTPYGQIPITQMISESHDTLSIFRWLSQWKKSAVKCPNEIICDFSRALIGALTRAFCDGLSQQGYVEKCFIFLYGQTTDLPPCIIRIDVAHVIKIFCRIKCLVGQSKKHLKEFYVRCLRLLMESATLNEFRIILTHLLTIVLSETDGWIDTENSIKTSSEIGREFLIGRMKGLRDDQELKWPDETEDINEKPEEFEETEQSINKTESFLEDILSESKLNSKQTGNRISAYYLPELATDIIIVYVKISHCGHQS